VREEPDVVIDYPIVGRVVLLLLLMGAFLVGGIVVSETAANQGLYSFVLIIDAIGVVWLGWFSIRTEIRRSGLVISRGIWPPQRVVSVGYDDVGRVRTRDLNDKDVMGVSISLNVGRWRDVQVAWAVPRASYMRVRGEESLPNVEPRPGESDESLRLRRIARLLESRTARRHSS
jgi:hypothetical protein